MTTSNNFTTTVRDAEKDALVLRLERNQKEVRQLRRKLNSYICEPCTYSLFERIGALKSGLDALSSKNNEIIRSIREKRKSVDEYVDRVKEQFLEFHALQDGVHEYIQDMHG